MPIKFQQVPTQQIFGRSYTIVLICTYSNRHARAAISHSISCPLGKCYSASARGGRRTRCSDPWLAHMRAEPEKVQEQRSSEIREQRKRSLSISTKRHVSQLFSRAASYLALPSLLPHFTQHFRRHISVTRIAASSTLDGSGSGEERGKEGGREGRS